MIWHIEKRKVADLKEWEQNPRLITEEAYNKLKQSVDDLGNFEPLVINTDGTVLAGNQRLKIARENGKVEVEVSVPERQLTEDEIKRIGVISNSHSGSWDLEKLTSEFNDVLDGLGLDNLTGAGALDELEGGSFMKKFMDERSDNFSITLLFDKKYEEGILGLIHEHGKDYLTEVIIKLVEQ